jgi:IclR family transcriptional regulator, pca regulon regulatory protein
MRPKSGRTDREYIVGLEKGLAVIEAFGRQQSRMTLTEAAKATGLPRATARRCLRTLERLGYASCDGKYFRLAPRTLRLGSAYLTSDPLARTIQPVIEAASELAGESISVAVLDGIDVIIIARALVRRSLSSGLSIGGRLPAYCSANGRILLSRFSDEEIRDRLKDLPRHKLTAKTKIAIPDILKEVRRARAQGYAVNDEEVEMGLRSVALPLRNRDGDVVASVSQQISDPTVTSNQILKIVMPAVERTRNRIASFL